MSATLTPLTGYYTTANSTVLTTAELLVTSVGTPTTFAGGSTVDSSTGWYEVGLGGASTTFFGGIQSPTGAGALFDLNIQGQMLVAGSYSASMQFSLSQAATSMSGSMVLRFYKYNALAKTYTSIGSITNASVNINSTSAVTVTWAATQFSGVTFDFDDYLYLDIWFNVTANTMTTGGQFQIIIPNSSTQGIATEYFATPGYVTAISQHALALDNYTRANQSGWGSANDHLNSWTARDGTATYSILSNQGKILQNSTSVDELNTLFSPPTGVEYEIYGVCTVNNNASHVGFTVNYQSAGNFVKCEISPTATQIVRYVSNSQTTIFSDTALKVTTANDIYNMRFKWQPNGAYFFKVWKNTATEPTFWNVNGSTDATYNSGAVGIYLAPRHATTDVCLWSQFYVSYSDLNGNTVINGLTLDDSSSILAVEQDQTDAVSAPIDSQAWVVNPVPVDSLTSNDSATTFALSDTFPVDSLAQIDVSMATVIQKQSDPLSAPTDSEAWVEVFVPTDNTPEIETQLDTIAETITADSLTPSDSTLPTNNPSLSDVLSEAESAAYAISETAPVESMTGQESVLYALTELNTDALSDTESSAYALAQTNAATPLTLAEIDAIADYYSVEEDLTVTDTQLEVIVESPTSDSVTSSEVTTIKIVDNFPTVNLTQTETDLTAVTQTDTTTIGTTDDTIIFGQPGIIFPDQLTITDSISFAAGRPLVDVGLLPSDSLDFDTNFTDHVHIVEDVVFSYSSSLLDARSVLYSNTISDGPTAYYQLNEDTFGGIFQRDGSDQPNNASLPILYGATFEYTWAQIEPDENNRLFSIIDSDLLPWQNQGKRVILRVVVSSTPFYNSTHNNNTAGQATPQWVFDAGAPSVTGLDGAVYPVYWNDTFLEKYANFINAFADYYDENSIVAGIIISCGVNGTTSLEASGDTPTNTTSLWSPRGYTPAQWMSGIVEIINIYQNAFQHTPLILSVNDAVIAPDNVYNIHQCISIAVAEAAWLMDENVFINEQHNDPNWNIVPLVTVPKTSIASGNTPDTLDGQLTLAVNYQADYAAVWADDITSANDLTLVKYFNLAQTKGLNDSATSNFKMSIFGGVYPTSHISTGDYLNGAQQFDGLTGFGYVGRLAQTNTDKWTIKCTVFPQVLPMSEAIAFSVGNDGSTGYGGYAIGISGGSKGGPGAKFCVHLPGLGWFDSGYSFPQVGQWYQLFASFDGITLRFYANGVLCPNTYNVTANAPSLAMTIGAQWDGMSRTAKRLFIGSVDECAVYPFALDASRVLDLSDIEYGMNELLTGSGSAYSLTEQLTVDDTSSTTNDVFMSSDALNITEGFAYSIASSNVASYETLAQDQFNRLSSGLGIATDGNTWQVKAGSSTLSVDGNVGQSTGDTSTNILFLGDTDEDMEDVSCMFKISDTSSTFGILAFGTDASNYYSLRCGSNLQLYKTVTGTSTTLGSGSAFSLSAGTWYHLHLKVSQGTLYGNIWADGSAEPVSWMVTAADATFSSGSTGLYIKGASAGTVFNFDNFLAIDNALSDFVLLQESYTLTSILPPLVDTIPAIIDASITAVSLSWSDDALSGSDILAPNVNAMGIDFLLFAASLEAWSIAYLPTEQITEQEVLTTPVVIDLPADAAPPLSDSITPNVTPVPVDQVEPVESLAEIYEADLIDTPTLIDVSTITQIRNIVDTDPSKRYIIRAFGGLIIIKKNTPLIASDRFTPTDNAQDTSILATSDSVSHGPAYFLTDSLNIVEQALFALNETIPVDSTAQPTDTVTPTIVPSPIDSLTEQEIIVFAVGPVLPADLTGANLEEDLLLLLSDNFDAETVTSDDSATQEIVTFAPTEIVTLSDDVQSYTVTFAPTEIVTLDESVTFESVQSNSDNVQVSDSNTLFGVTPVPVESNSVQESVTLLLSDNFASDTPNEIEVLLSIVTETFDVYTSVPSDTVQAVTLNFDETDFVEVEIVTPVVIESNTDLLTVTETELNTDAQTELDNLSNVTELDTIDLFYDAEDVILIESDFIFTIEAVEGTDLVSTSESLIQIETFIYALPDIALPAPVESVTFTVISVPVDLLESIDSVIEYLYLTFDADIASIGEELLDTIMTSFTGWLDLNNVTESTGYAVISVPIEQENETESYIFADSNIYQDSSTPNSEVYSYSVTQNEDEQSNTTEIVTVTLALPVTEQSNITDASTVTVVLLGDIPLLLTESYTCNSETVTLEGVTLAGVTLTGVTQNDLSNTVTLAESNSYTPEIVTLEGVTVQDVTQVTGVQSDNFNAVTVSESNTVTPEIVTLEGVTVQDAVTQLYVVTVTDISPITDASTTTSVTLSSDTLVPGENVLYSTIMAPVETQTLREVLAATLIHAETDSSDIEELLSGIGYGLLDGSLNIVEIDSVSSASYIKTFGVVRTGQADGIIRTGTSTGIVRRGTADGVIA